MYKLLQTTTRGDDPWTCNRRSCPSLKLLVPWAAWDNSKRIQYSLLLFSLIILLLSLTGCGSSGGGNAEQGGSNAGSEGTIGTPQVVPNPVTAGIPQIVTVTSQIGDASLTTDGVNLQRLDGQNNAINLGAMHDDGLNGDAVAGDHIYTVQTTIFEDAPTAISLRVTATSGLLQKYSLPGHLNITGTATGIRITSPKEGAYTNTSPTTVSGAVGNPSAQVAVNGISTPVSNKQFVVPVPLREGPNILTAVAQNPNLTTSTNSVLVTLDTTPPHVAIYTPADKSLTADSSAVVTGLVNDIVVGTVNDKQATVTVNGQPAAVLNRTFSVSNIPLSMGPNTIQAIATDRAGNSATTTATITRQPITGPTLLIYSGNGQSGTIQSQLPKPLVAQFVNVGNKPIPNATVIFQVTGQNGTLNSGNQSGVPSVAVTTDANGLASANFTLGSRAGAGNNVVEASTVGVATTAVFTASANSSAAGLIVVDSGNNQSGVINQPLPLPFTAIVTDTGYNRLPNVPVTFTVKKGAGNFAGQSTFTATSDSDGRVQSILTLDSNPGINNNLVETTFKGNAGQPAVFTATGLSPGLPDLTQISGVVLDNSNQPIPGVTMHLYQVDSGMDSNNPVEVAKAVKTDAQGQFVMLPVPVGVFKLMADGGTAEPNGTFPTLEYDIVTVVGQDNTVGLPIYLPRLDAAGKLCVDEKNGGTLTIPQVPGYSLTIAPGSATFPGGSRSGCVTVSAVNMDKVPMSPGFGQQPRFIVTIQPVGTTFNPPAPMSIPNVDGLPPRAVTEMYSYDHDLAQFVAIGSASVSTDGSVIRTDPGVGVLKAGWHCGGNPNTKGTVADCPDCKICDGTNCVTDPGKDCSCCGKGKGVCSGGSCNDVGAGQCPAKKAVIPTVKNLGGDPGCSGTDFGLTTLVQPSPDPTVTACVDGSCMWGFRVGDYQSTVNATPCNTAYTQAHIDVTGPNDPSVKEGTYCAIIQDLTPDATGRPTRNTYWSKSITTKHENFHVTEWQNSLNGRWPTFQNTVEGLGAAFSCTLNSPGAALNQQQTAINTAFTSMFNSADTDWINLGEDPAYLDGKASYQALVDGVCAQAKKAGWTKSTPCSACK
jgi:hypothetical protein